MESFENTNRKIKIKKVKPLKIPDDAVSKVYITNNVVEAITTDKTNYNLSKYRKLSKEMYVDISTGEVHHYKSDKNSKANKYINQKTFITLRRIINNNFVGDFTEKHIVLTYGSEMTDYRQANKDFKDFWARFSYKYPDFEYIRIIEPQQNGTWHIHVLIKYSSYRPIFIEQNKLNKIWGMGMVWISNIPFSDNFGAYFSARFSDVDIFENNQTYDNKKSIVKGGRLKFYPPNFKLYTCSKGIKRPVAIYLTHSEVENLVKNREPFYSYTNNVKCEDENGNELELNNITYEQFNLKRGD